MPPESKQSAVKSKAAAESKARTSQSQSASEVALQECEELEAELAVLKVSYEHFFLGAERHPPTRAHEELKKRFQRLKANSTRNTAVKFRLQSYQSKLATYERLWSRTLQEIENGTYKRDVLKAKRRAQQLAGGAEGRKKAGPHELPEELSDDDVMEVEETPPTPTPRPVAAPVAPVAPVVPPVAAPVVAPVAAPVAPAGAGSTPFRGSPVVAPVAPVVAPVVPPVAPAGAGSTPFRGSPAVPAGVAPAIPKVGAVPAMPTSGRGLPAITAAVAPVPTRPSGTQVPAVGAPSGPAQPAAARPAAPPGVKPASSAPGAAAARPPVAAASGGLSDDKLRAVYDAYVSAKRRCQEDTSKMSYETVAATLRKQVPELLKQHKASAVEFKVVIKDGKAMLKAVPK